MKRILSVALVLVLALSLGTMALASSEEEDGSSLSYGPELWEAMREEEGYSIYVEDTTEDMTYNVYRLFDITEEDDSLLDGMISSAESFLEQIDVEELIDEALSILDQFDSMDIDPAFSVGASGEPASDDTADAWITAAGGPYTTEVGNGGEMIVQVDDQGVYYITDADDLPVMLAVIVPTELSSDILTYFGLDSIIAEMEGASASGEMESVLGNIFNTDIMTEILDNFLGDVDMGSLNFSRLVYQDILSLYTTIPLSGNDFQLVIEVVGAEVNSVSAINPR